MDKKTFIWDLETLNIFTATFRDADKNSDYKRTFILTKTINQIPELINFLDNEVSGLIGYNSIFFDAQIIEFIYRNPDCTAIEIRNYAQLITKDNNRRVDVPEWRLRHKHLDLFKALSLSTSAKRTSLKWTEYMMDLENIEDMPSQGDGKDWVEMVLSYNDNDVIATKELYHRYYYEIELRKKLTVREGINLMNSTEPDMSKKLFTKYLSKKMGIYQNDLRSMGTDRDFVNVKDIIFSYVNFKTSILQNVKKEFEKLILGKNDKFEFEIIFGGIKTNFGLGGIHAAVDNKIVESNNEFIIKSLDVKSYYPNLAIRNKLCPAHIPKDTFLELYEGFYNERKEIPKSDPRNYILKILLNSTYGLTNDKFSFLRDRQMTLSICINGQLLLCQLFEELLLNIPESKLIMLNTDGGEILIPKKYENLYNKISKDWEKLTNLVLEFDEYKKLIIADCNNYIGIFKDNSVKFKGRFEVDGIILPGQNKPFKIPLHKNKSHNIIPLAVYNYFVYNISVEDTILNHKNIFDFCAGKKTRKSDKKGYSHYELHYIEGSDLKKIKLSKTVRYFISNKGKYLVKVYENGDWQHVEAPKKIGKFTKDWKVTYFNKYFKVKDFKDYNIDYSYYISKSKKWITELEDKQQLKLFN